MSYKRCPKYKIIGVLRQTRRAQRLSLAALSEKAGYHVKSLIRWEHHRAIPSIPALEDWCRALNVACPIQ